MEDRERLAIAHQRMPELDIERRRRSWDEVNLGYTEELARTEAERCLQCKRAPCVTGCPVEIDIPGFILKIRQGDFRGAVETIKLTNSFPSICGRVCPQERQCQARCVVGKRGDPVGIGHLERFVGDWQRAQGIPQAKPGTPTGKKVAVVGSGPAGLTVAGDLAKLGHQVTVFEALHRPGGVLVFGIPEFRLPNEIVDYEIEYLRQLGVQIRVDTLIGATVTMPQLLEEKGYDAVFLGLGAGSPIFMGIEGENLPGVYSANEFLTRVNLMQAHRPDADTPLRMGDRVAVIGGGNTAMDASRTAVRLGAKSVRLVYRRSREEMPARVEEVRHAEEEGVDFAFQTVPVRFIADDTGNLAAMECVRTELGPPDESGRRRPVVVEGSNFTEPVDIVVVAIGARPNPLVRRIAQQAGVELDAKGHVIVDHETGRTNVDRIWAGGDIVGGEETVIKSMGDGKRAARDIHEYLTLGARA